MTSVFSFFPPVPVFALGFLILTFIYTVAVAGLLFQPLASGALPIAILHLTGSFPDSAFLIRSAINGKLIVIQTHDRLSSYFTVPVLIVCFLYLVSCIQQGI